MSETWPKIIRDPVHNLITFSKDERLLLNLINTREFQRLRRIKQLGVSFLVFPGATHTRLAHSIGVMHVARRLLHRVAEFKGENFVRDHRLIVLAAALLHDVGHGPFSHAFEKISREDHEQRTLAIILDDSTEVSRCLQDVDRELPSRIAAFFDTESNGKTGIPEVLTHIVSSQLDADRFDYLLRDTRATGTKYGDFDLDWLIEHIEVCEGTEGSHFALNEKAILAGGQYIMARHQMYQNVYFHKTVRAAEVMLRLLFQRYKELLDNAASEQAKEQIVPSAPATLRRAFAGSSIALSEYLALDDSSVTEFLKGCESANDGILTQLGHGLLNRQLFKIVTEADDVGEFTPEAIKLVEGKGYISNYAFAFDKAADTPYKPYIPDTEQTAEQIYVVNPQGKLTELSERFKPAKELRQSFVKKRYYCPTSLRDPLRELATKKGL